MPCGTRTSSVPVYQFQHPGVQVIILNRVGRRGVEPPPLAGYASEAYVYAISPPAQLKLLYNTDIVAEILRISARHLRSKFLAEIAKVVKAGA